MFITLVGREEEGSFGLLLRIRGLLKFLNKNAVKLITSNELCEFGTYSVVLLRLADLTLADENSYFKGVDIRYVNP